MQDVLVQSVSTHIFDSILWCKFESLKFEKSLVAAVAAATENALLAAAAVAQLANRQANRLRWVLGRSWRSGCAANSSWLSEFSFQYSIGLRLRLRVYFVRRQETKTKTKTQTKSRQTDPE